MLFIRSNNVFNQKRTRCIASVSGERGIRTLDRDRPYSGFRDRPVQPLRHLSKQKLFYQQKHPPSQNHANSTPQQGVDLAAEVDLIVKPRTALRHPAKVDLPRDRGRIVRENENAVGEVERLVDIMRDEDRGAVELRAEVEQPILHILAGDDIQRPERLVQQHDIRGAQRRPQEGRPLPHPAGELRGVGVLVSLQAEAGEFLQRLLLGMLSVVMKRAVQRDVLEDRLPRQQEVALRHVGEVIGDAVHGFVIHEDPAFVGFPQAGEDIQHGGLAAAGRAEEGDEFALLGMKRHAAQHRLPFV